MKPVDSTPIPPYSAKTVAELFPFPRWIGFFPIALWPNKTEVRIFLGKKYADARVPAPRKLSSWKKPLIIWSIIAFGLWCISDGRDGSDPRMVWFWHAAVFSFWVNVFVLTIGWRFMFAWQYIRDRKAIQEMLDEGRTSLPSIRTIVARIQAAKYLEQRVHSDLKRAPKRRRQGGPLDPGLN